MQVNKITPASSYLWPFKDLSQDYISDWQLNSESSMQTYH